MIRCCHSGPARLVDWDDGLAKVPRRGTVPGPRSLHLYPGALRGQVHRVWNIQRAMVHHRCRTHRLVRSDLDVEGGGVLSVVLDRLAPYPGVATQRPYLELVFSDHRDRDCGR